MKIKNKVDAAQDKKVSAFLQIDEEAALYSTINGKVKMLGEEKDTLRSSLMEKVDLIGNKDDKGSVSVVTSRFKVVNQKSTRSSLNADKARAILSQKKLLSVVEKTTTYLDENEIAKLVDMGKLTPNEVKLMTDTKESISLVVKEAKDADRAS